MAHFKKMPQKKNEDKIVYGDKIVDGIVFLALSEVSYAELYSPKPHAKNHSNAIKVFFDKDGVHIDVNVKIHFSQCVSDMAFKIQETVRHNIESMTVYHVASVNVIVRGVLFDDLPAEKSRTESFEKEIDRSDDNVSYEDTDKSCENSEGKDNK